MKLTVPLLVTLLLATTSIYATGDAARGEELRSECSDCHGEEGLGDEDYPRLAGLDEDYLLKELKAIKKGEYSEEAQMMLWFFEDLEEQDLEDLAAYYSSLDGG